MVMANGDKSTGMLLKREYPDPRTLPAQSSWQQPRPGPLSNGKALLTTPDSPGRAPPPNLHTQQVNNSIATMNRSTPVSDQLGSECQVNDR
jgi:hypothetical protein